MAASKPSANLNELETKISTLERANFDLKLQLHYLNKKYSGGANPSVVGPEVNINVIEDRSVDVLSMREEIEYSKTRILQLESELLQVQLARDKEKSEFQKALQIKPPESAVIEENRRREREVAMAIAEHDALLIAKLRTEMEALVVQRESDKKLISDLTSQVESKDEEIGKLLAKKKSLEQELLEMEEANSARIAKPGKGAGGANNTPMLFSASSDGQQTSIVINSSSFAAGGSVGGPQAGPAPTSFLIHGAGGNPAYPAYGGHVPLPALPYLPYGGHSAGHRPGDHPSYDALRFENEQLKGRLHLLEESIRNQQVIIDNMKASAAEFKVMESEEVRRLEAELDKIIEEKEKMKQRLQKVEMDYEMACRHIKDLGEHLSANDPNHSISQEFLFTPNRNQALAGMRRIVDPNSAVEKANAQVQQAKRDIEKLEKTVEFYRQREAELLFALEGVVQRCQELEEQQSSIRYRR